MVPALGRSCPTLQEALRVKRETLVQLEPEGLFGMWELRVLERLQQELCLQLGFLAHWLEISI